MLSSPAVAVAYVRRRAGAPPPNGVDAVFGIPGGGTGQIFTRLAGKEPAIRTDLARHEQTAAIMAAAYAHAAGKPDVSMRQGAPGWRPGPETTFRRVIAETDTPPADTHGITRHLTTMP